ncbi:hypothetical protein SISSUDRAFT_1060273 [Sistotremastrum suecicum HHB10207 ss-3]|uniref:Uncharacterized protein n=1 Tax=Sistotremastrum suecicum HHB10207 ss-3 TaxID=1314776 RepID=A0A166FC97_9AGAM|nr:hypothetical protein SISSUDRAFT_1060273 [Sistotremastrum suecicum HHB10207 ss-3]
MPLELSPLLRAANDAILYHRADFQVANLLANRFSCSAAAIFNLQMSQAESLTSDNSSDHPGKDGHGPPDKSAQPRSRYRATTGQDQRAEWNHFNAIDVSVSLRPMSRQQKLGIGEISLQQSTIYWTQTTPMLTDCVFSAPNRRRGPHKGHVRAVETRLHEAEAIMGILQSLPHAQIRTVLEGLHQDPLAGRVLERVAHGAYGPLGRDQYHPNSELGNLDQEVGGSNLRYPSNDWQDQIIARLIHFVDDPANETNNNDDDEGRQVGPLNPGAVSHSPDSSSPQTPPDTT